MQRMSLAKSRAVCAPKRIIREMNCKKKWGKKKRKRSIKHFTAKGSYKLVMYNHFGELFGMYLRPFPHSCKYTQKIHPLTHVKECSYSSPIHKSPQNENSFKKSINRMAMRMYQLLPHVAAQKSLSK